MDIQEVKQKIKETIRTNGVGAITGKVLQDRMLEVVDSVYERAEEAEQTREQSETIRELNETSRIDNEETRQTSEGVRVSNENTRITDENARKTAESARNRAEQTRSAKFDNLQRSANDAIGKANTAAISAEDAAKKAAETESRIETEETKRAEAETARETEFNTLKGQMNTAKEKAEKAAQDATTAAGSVSTAIQNANNAANNANDKAALAEAAATNAETKTQEALDKVDQAQVIVNAEKLTELEAFKEIAKKQITTTQELKDTLVLNVGSFYGTGTNVTLKLDDTQYRYSDPFTMQKGDRFSAHEVNTHPFSRALIVSVNEDGTYTKLLYVRESVNDWEYIEESESRLVSVCFRYNANNTYSFIRTIKGYLEDIIDNEINVRNANESKGKLLNNPFVKSFAHQGYYPNGNRITSFYNAYLKGADVFLCNQVWTSDTKAVCAHEGTITMTNISTGESESVVIGEHTLEDLQSNYLYYGEKIASLEDVLYLAKCTGKMVFMVNVSNINSTKRNYIKSLVAKYGMRDKVIWGLSSSYSTLIQEAESICNWYNYSHISILSSTFSSVSTDAIAEIESNIGKALQIATEYNHVMLWVNAGFPEEKYAEWNDMISNPSYWSEEIGAKCAIARIGIGCFDNRTIAEGQARTYDNIMKILPYISYVSSYDKSYKDMISKIEAGLKEKFLIMG